MAAYRSFLKTIPKLYWRSASERRKPIQQVVAEADAKAKATGKPVECLGPVTINKHVSNIGSFLAWAQKEQYMPDITPFWGGIYLPTGAAVPGLAEHEELKRSSNTPSGRGEHRRTATIKLARSLSATHSMGGHHSSERYAAWISLSRVWNSKPRLHVEGCLIWV